MGYPPHYSHHQPKKRLFRFLSNTAFDTMAVQTALLGPICQSAGLQGLTMIMIDWPDLAGEAAACSPQSVSEVGVYPAQLGCHAGITQGSQEPVMLPVAQGHH